MPDSREPKRKRRNAIIAVECITMATALRKENNVENAIK